MARDGLYRHLNEVQLEDEPRWLAVRQQRQTREIEPAWA